MADYVIVPIDVAALVIGGSRPANTGFAPPLTRFDLLPYGSQETQQPFNSEIALNGPFVETSDQAGGTTSSQPGVHVHWAMPDALMHATREKDRATGAYGPWKFPVLPDMWLVTRIARVPGKADAVRYWVVDSRFVAAQQEGAAYNIGSSAVPWVNANDPTFQQAPFRHLGRAVPLDDWATVGASGDHVDHLDAKSFGMIELAAYYPNVANVFGVYDGLDGVAIDTGVELCYAVTGWHSRGGDDPLAGKTLDDALAVLKGFKWAVGKGSDKAWSVELTAAPAGTAYCGVVHSIKWATPNNPAPSQLKVSFGNTTSEALSALLVKAGEAPGDADKLEFLLHSLLTGQLPVLADTAGQRVVTRQLHKQRFSPVTATLTWYVRRSSDGADVSAEQDDALRAQLDTLNQQQAAADVLRNQVQGLRWQVYADWLKYLEVKYGQSPDGLGPDQSDAVAAFMLGNDLSQGANGDYGLGGDVVRPDAPLPAVQKAITDLGAAMSACQGTLQTLTPLVAQIKPPAAAPDVTFALAQKPGEVFFQPSDPTVLLSGNDVVPTLRYGGDTLQSEEGTLACRLSSWLVSALTAPAGAIPSSPALTLNAQDWPGLASNAGAPADVAASFLVDSLLLWPAAAAAKLAGKSGGDAAIPGWQTWVQAQETAFLAASDDGNTTGYQGRKPSPVGIDAWDGNPWLPIMLHWEIDYRPTQLVPPDASQQPTLDPKLILGRLDPSNDSLDSDATELTLAGDFSAETSYLGINFITPHAGYAALKRLKEYAAAHKDSPLAPLADKLTPMPLLSQALTGFHDRFLLRRRTLQLEVRDPFASTAGPEITDFITQVVAAVAGGDTPANSTAPMVEDSFCPVRAGSLAVKAVWLVDAFGQYRKFDTESNAISTEPARSISPQRMHAGGITADAFMPPRISQPALLRFNWLAANSGAVTTGTQPGSTPICGWLVPNYLDVSLMAYDADGTALGSIAQVDQEAKWLAAPSDPAHFGATAPTAKNQRLLDFLNALIAKGPQYLIEFLDSLNNASTTIQPLQHAQSAQLPVLVGQPLALVRGSLELKLISDPAINNNWAAFKQDLETATKGKSTPRTTNGHESVQFPVLVGSVDDPDDGLLGFYLGSAFDTFHAVVPNGGGSIPTRKIDTVTVSVAGGPVVVSMLVDPRCDVHATTGYMPTQALRIPTAMFRDAFANIAVTFLTAPVLAAAQAKGSTPAMALPLPLPGQQGGDWSWLTVKGAHGGPRQVEEIKPVTPLKPGVPFGDPAYVLQDGWLSLKGFEG
jgi:hypothetical protein